MQIDKKLEVMKKMDILGIKLACMYSCKCENAMNFGVSEILRNFINNPKESKNEIVKKTLRGLSSFKHYQNIASANKIEDPFDFNVVSYYWKGTPILESELFHNYTTLMPIFSMPMKYIDAGVVDICIVHSAEIIEIKKNSFVAKYKPIVKRGGKLIIGDSITKEIENSFMLKCITGDFITIHFNIAVEKINENEVSALKNVTKQALEKFQKNRLVKSNKKTS